MEIFINEYSLTGQYYDKEGFETSLKNLVSIFSFLNQEIKNKDKQIFGDFQILINYEAIKNLKFIAAYNKSNLQLRQSFLNNVFQRSGAKNWTSDQVHLDEDSFFYLDIHDVSNTSIAEATERTLQNPNNNYLLVNFINSIFCVEDFRHPDIHECFLTPIVKNDSSESPIHLVCLDNKSALENWLKVKQVLKDVELKEFLKDTTRFQKTSHNWQGQSIYLELLTKRYWYLDNLHKNHFEVFDSTGKNHLGIADLEGNIDETKNEPSRSIEI
jgi:hypothetical protein